MRLPLIALALSAVLGCSNTPPENHYRAAVHSTATDARKLKAVVEVYRDGEEISPHAAEVINNRLDAIIERAK